MKKRWHPIDTLTELTTPEGVLRFDLELRIDMREMSEWKPAEIREFFAGIARASEAVKTARARLEAEQSESPREDTTTPGGNTR